MTGYEYEKKCAELLKAKGFTDVKVTPGSGDQGIDILAKKSRKKYGVQCKYYEGSVGNKAVQEAFAGASYYDCAMAMVITNSKLTAAAKALAKKLNVEVWEGVDAIYLRKNNADYIKKEREKEKRAAEKRKAVNEAKAKQKRLEEEEKFQQQLARFQQWQVAYQKVITKIECLFAEERARIDKEHDEKKKGLSQQAEQNDIRIQMLKSRITAMKAEAEQRTATLKTTSVLHFSTRKQLGVRIKEIAEEVNNLSSELDTAINEPEVKRVALEAEYSLQVRELKRNKETAYREAKFPKCPAIVKKGAKDIVAGEDVTENSYGYICVKEAGDEVQRFDIYNALSQYTPEEIRGIFDVDFRLKRELLMFVAANNGGVSTMEVYEGVAAAKAHSVPKISSMLRKMENEGLISSEKKRGKSMFFPYLGAQAESSIITPNEKVVKESDE